MKYAITSLLVILLSFDSIGQISFGGEPYQWNSKSELPCESIELPPIDLKKLEAEDAILDQYKNQPYRFGQNIGVDIDLHKNGIWTELENGDGIWRLALHSEGARSLNFVVDDYRLPEGGRIFVYSEDKSQLLGSFTRENASEINSLGVGLIFADKAIIEYHEPAEARGLGYLHINNVTHGYRDILVDVKTEAKGAFGDADECNININCPEGLPFDFQKRSVAVIVVGNNGICSGALVNNTLQDETPLFLTANHCLPNNTDNTQNWVFYFNHESPGCEGNNGPTDQSISGGTLLSSNDESDFALLELNDTPPNSYNVCYSGWDATDSESAISSAYGIHHPRGDVKKICFEEDAPYHDVINTFVNQVWYIDQWELGVTEGGSSGSPLFNQNGHIIGQLSGGQAACEGDVNNGSFDYYGRMGVSWNYGSTETTAIRFALDPANTGILIVPNSCGSLPDINASLGLINGIPETFCTLSTFSPNVNAVNLGIETIEEIVLEVNLNGNIELVNWSGIINPQENTFIPLGEITPTSGFNELSVEIISVNGEADTDAQGNMVTEEFEAFEEATQVTVNINLDNFPNETTWLITNALNDVMASGGPYNDSDDPVADPVCLPDGCYDFTIFDSEDDGICCQWGPGSYTVTDQFGTVLASGGSFGSSEVTEICALLDTQNTPKSELILYPNPARDILVIDAVDKSLDRASIFDIRGKLVSEKRGINSPRTKFNTNALPAGLYVVEVVGADGSSYRNKVIVSRRD